MIRIVYLFYLGCLFINCSNATKNIDSKFKDSLNNKKTYFVIDKVDTSLIGNKINASLKDILFKQYFLAMDREMERPYMWDISLSNVSEITNFYEYNKIVIQGEQYNIYLMIINYEDASYNCIFVLDNLQIECRDKSLILFEDLVSEESYKRVANINNNP